MEFINKYALFLFDFDGVLVDSEKLHFTAYRLMCEQRGFNYPLSWDNYKNAALYAKEGLKKALYNALPQLFQQEPDWSVLYKEKKRFYYSLLLSEPVSLMPGVERLLGLIETSGKPYCVVTNSARAEVEAIAKHHRVLGRIPKWFTREDYHNPKPDPECYLKAIEYFQPQGDVVGFEDSPKGLKALLGAPVHAHLVGSVLSLEERLALESEHGRRFEYLSSLESLWSE